MTNQTGRIFDIQRFSVHDGPGIRTIVFLKGCPLRCRWCCNPEGQSFEKETMRTETGSKIVGEDITVEEVMKTIRCDRPYYRRSGGGVTLSGGEVLSQPDFALALLSACQKEGLHTAIETTGYATEAVLHRLLPKIDLVMMDIKHMDSEKHKAYTGKANDMILANAKFIARHARELIIRVPVIPGFNDTDAEIKAIAQFASSLPNVRNLHLLPYHRLGSDKYTSLNRDYNMGSIDLIADVKMERLLAVAQESGLACQIGG